MDARILDFKLPEHDPLEKIRQLPKKDLTDVLYIIEKEEMLRPELTALLKQLPSLFIEYLQLSEQNKKALASFYQSNRGYFQNHYHGDDIRKLDNASYNIARDAANIARKCRLVQRLVCVYDLYVLQDKHKKLSRAYIEKYHDGIPFFAMIRNNHFDIVDIIHLAEELRPGIGHVYNLPVSQRTFGDVVQLRR